MGDVILMLLGVAGIFILGMVAAVAYLALGPVLGRLLLWIERSIRGRL